MQFDPTDKKLKEFISWNFTWINSYTWSIIWYLWSNYSRFVLSMNLKEIQINDIFLSKKDISLFKLVEKETFSMFFSVLNFDNLSTVQNR